MIKLKENKVTEFELDSKKLTKDLKEAYPYAEFDEDIIKNLIPKYGECEYTYNLYNINTFLANGWRRCMLDEICRFPKLSTIGDRIETDDAYCQRQIDYIQNRIWLIPTSYIDAPTVDVRLAINNYEYKNPIARKYFAEIDVKNNTQQPMIIKSSDIKTSNDFPIEIDPNINIISILPGSYFKCVLCIRWGTNREHSSYYHFGPIKYSPIGYDLDSKSLPLSETIIPTNYELGVLQISKIYGDPKDMVTLGWENLLRIVYEAYDNLKEFLNGTHDLPYLSQNLVVTKTTMYEFKFLNQTNTLVKLIAYYVFKNYESIDFCAGQTEHPEKKMAKVVIYNENENVVELGEKIKLAISNVADDINNILDLFENN